MQSQVEGERSKLSHFLASVTQSAQSSSCYCLISSTSTGPTLIYSSVSSTSYSFFLSRPFFDPPICEHSSTVPQNGLFLYYTSHLLCSDYLLLSNCVHFSPNTVPTLVHICLFVVQNNPFFPHLLPSLTLIAFFSGQIIGQSTAAPANRVF